MGWDGVHAGYFTSVIRSDQGMGWDGMMFMRGTLLQLSGLIKDKNWVCPKYQKKNSYRRISEYGS